MTEKEILIEKFYQLLNSSSTSENDIQTFLETNSSLIPLPFILNHALNGNSVISKLNLGNTYVTDFAYLTKSTVKWQLVLIELEESKKKFFTKENLFSAEFNRALAQIDDWKIYCDKYKDRIMKQTNALRNPLNGNPVEIFYVLIYGRNEEYQNDEYRSAKIAELEKNSNLRVMSYDSLVSEFRYKTAHYEDKNKIILSPRGDEKFSLKYHSNVYGSFLFDRIDPNYLEIPKNFHSELLNLGYDIKKWL
ncbi:Uncharacterised protein [Sebaldella termitidis]|uniref:Shedu protein SduA C-terminal domain-containing protein n=1 Tax=Sebaldella termitidis (strain ATCC 33386 / NCTC 11300) TaxID=526218 RepID=D1ARY6_SEBTE|nr:Shedu immune nuclease family protein [Sebaldella termitidis]ACZ10973.1 hypothetical protein Sterm_4141 [Sebaldella termitidis ATCC 33386]SUI81332.1 Uncharacterised protein [Sebaldella termitidis]